MINIRKSNPNDLKKLADIWFEASVKAHFFIPAIYWKKNKIKMQEEYLPLSEIYVAEDAKELCGFIALVENKVAAIFVSPEQQTKGIGTLLISYAQNIRDQLELNVYQENLSSVQFYKSRGFNISEETTDLATDSKEFVMCWEK